MKIFVRSRQQMVDMLALNAGLLENSTGNAFIMISGGLDDVEDYPTDYDGDNVIKCRFDDVTDVDWENLSNIDRSYMHLFNEEDAKRIKEFIEKNKNRNTLYVNCMAGISRSGAIGTAINLYINRDGDAITGDAMEFYEKNRHIKPNQYILRIMRNALEGPVDYGQVFKEQNVSNQDEDK